MRKLKAIQYSSQSRKTTWLQGVCSLLDIILLMLRLRLQHSLEFPRLHISFHRHYLKLAASWQHEEKHFKSLSFFLPQITCGNCSLWGLSYECGQPFHPTGPGRSHLRSGTFNSETERRPGMAGHRISCRPPPSSLHGYLLALVMVILGP